MREVLRGDNQGGYSDIRRSLPSRAHREIRRICLKMLEALKAEAPIVFDDFEIDRETESARIVES